MNTHQPSPTAPSTADHQAIAIDVICAYGALNLVNQAELAKAFDGDMNIHGIHQLAKRMLDETSKEDLAKVLARLILMANEAGTDVPGCAKEELAQELAKVEG